MKHYLIYGILALVAFVVAYKLLFCNCGGKTGWQAQAKNFVSPTSARVDAAMSENAATQQSKN